MIVPFLIVLSIFSFGFFYNYFYVYKRSKARQLTPRVPSPIPESELKAEVKTATPQPEKIIVTFKEATYDVTDFVDEHPGGRDILVKKNGKDVEQCMRENEHSDNAYNILDKYRIA